MNIAIIPTYSLVSLLLLLSLTGIQGCSYRTSESFADGSKIYIDELSAEEKEQAREEISLAVNDSLYRYKISSGDVLEVMYHIESTLESEDYVLSVNDEILIEFLHQEEMNRELKIRPDGKITLPRKGDIVAAGLKPMELSSLIKEMYNDTFRDMTVTTTVLKYSSKIQELKEAVQNTPLGQAKMVTVNPDGYIHVPLLTEVKASNLTVGELEREIDKQYQKHFRNLQVSLFLKSVSGNNIFVFGEVRQPGTIRAVEPMTLLQAIAQVGGVKDTGSIKEVKLLYWDKSNTSHVRTVNLYNVLEEMRLEEDVLLANNSVIFVPKTGIAMANEFVDQYIRQLFLFNGSSIGVTYELNDVRVR